MEKQKKEPLATEVIQEQTQKINCFLAECEGAIIDLEKAYFVLSELSEIVDTEPKNKLEALYFANEQHRIYSYTDIAFDYVSRVKSNIEDLIIRAGRTEPERNGGKTEKEDKA